jgi:hypothetical protein
VGFERWVAPILILILPFWGWAAERSGWVAPIGDGVFSVFLWGFGSCDLMCHTPREEYIASGNDCRSVDRLTLRTRNTLC